MKGIVIKPTPCCGNTSDLGRIYNFLGEVTDTLFFNARCINCGNVTYDHQKYYQTDSFVPGYTRAKVVGKDRVKFFNDDLDEELETEYNEDIVKEKEKL